MKRQQGARNRRRAGPKPGPFSTCGDHIGDQVYGEIRGALRPLDEMAAHMEAKWGVGRLETLVTPETAAKFGRVTERLNAAIAANCVEAVKADAAIMWRAWQALDAEAAGLGHPALPAGVWELEHDGKLFRVCLTDDARNGIAAHQPPDDRARVVSVEELLRIMDLEQNRIVKQALDVFPGAKVTDVRKARPAEGGPLFEAAEDRLIEDEIPF